MTENDMESNSGDGVNATPNAGASSQDGSQTSTVDVEALVAALKPSIEEIVDRKTQSVKDVRFSKLTSKVDEFQSQLSEFKKLTERGLSEEDALWRMSIDSKLNSEPVASGNPVGNQGNQSASVDTKAILLALGLDANSPEVTNVLQKTNVPSEQIVAFANLATGKKQAAPNPASVQPTGGGQAPYGDANAIAERLNTLYLNPTKNLAEIKKLTEALDGMIEKR